MDRLYYPIHVGKSLSKIDLPYLLDNTGDNISLKNKEYCELTAHYWAWKNIRDVKYIGLCHYRRYLNLYSNCFSVYLREMDVDKYKSTINVDKEEKKIVDTLSKYDIILPKFWRTPWSIKRDFYISVCEQDFEILCRVIKNKYPDYFPYFEKFCLGNRRTGCNMFITSIKIFDEYSNWLFDVLFEVEKHVKISSYSYYRRIFGFMSEVLLPVYCYRWNLKIKEKQMLFLTSTGTSNLFTVTLKRFIKNITNTIAYRLIKLTPEKISNTDFWNNYFKNDNIKI